MCIPFKDPRHYMVGRQDLVHAVAEECKATTAHRCVLHGESGAGKTLVAIAAGFALWGSLPMQVFMQASSHVTLQSELALFARSHVQGLPEDAEEEELVQALHPPHLIPIHLNDVAPFLTLTHDFRRRGASSPSKRGG